MVTITNQRKLEIDYNLSTAEKVMDFRHCLLCTSLFNLVSLCNQCTCILIFSGKIYLVEWYIWWFELTCLCYCKTERDLNPLMLWKAMRWSSPKLMHYDLTSHLIMQRNLSWCFIYMRSKKRNHEITCCVFHLLHFKCEQTEEKHLFSGIHALKEKCHLSIWKWSHALRYEWYSTIKTTMWHLISFPH